jgi:peroxiredoxin
MAFALDQPFVCSETVLQFQSGGQELATNLLNRRFVVLIIGILLASLAVASDGSPAQLRLLDLSGQAVDPLHATGSKAVVVLFIRTDCPISNRYAPEVRRLYEKFTALGVTFWLVYPDPDESVEMIRQHIKEYEYHLEALRDPAHALVKLTGVRVTPEAAVFVGERLVYRGRIDDRFVAFGKARQQPTTRDLERAIEAILKGQTITPETTTAIGCFIPDL